MKKCFILFFLTIIAFERNAFAQTDSFDVYYYQPPAFFNKKQLPSMLQFNLTNSDTSFCTLLLYKSQPAKDSVLLDVKTQWKNYVVGKLAKADKKPGAIYTEQLWDG